MSRRAWGVLFALYFVSRLCRLTLLPIFIDEAIHILWSQDLLGAGFWDSLLTGRFLQVAAIAGPVALAGHPLLAARLVSVLAGAFGLFVVGRLAARLADERVALAASALYILCPFVFFYDRLALADVFCTTFASLTFLLALRAAESPRLREALAMAAAVLLTLLSKVSAFFVLFWPVCALLARRGRVSAVGRPWSMAYALVAIVLAGPLYFFLSGTPLIGLQGAPFGTLSERGALLARNVGLSMRWLWVYWTAPLTLLGLAGLVLGLVRRNRTAFALLIAALLPILTIGSAAREWFPRYVLASTVPFVILAATAVVSMQRFLEQRTRLWPRAGWTVLVLLAGLPALRFQKALVTDPTQAPLPGVERQQYLGWASAHSCREALLYLEGERARSGGGMTFVFDSPGLRTLQMALRVRYLDDEDVDVPVLDLGEPGAAERLGEWSRLRPTLVLVPEWRVAPPERQVLSALPLVPGPTFLRPNGALLVRVYRAQPPVSR